MSKKSAENNINYNIETAAQIIMDEPLDDYHKLVACRAIAAADGIDPDTLFNTPTNNLLGVYTDCADNIVKDNIKEVYDHTCESNSDNKRCCCNDCCSDDEKIHTSIYNDYDTTGNVIHALDITPQILNAHTANLIMNQYTFIGVPCVLFGSVDRGFCLMTEGITYEFIQNLADSDGINILMYTDGYHTTCIKDGTEAIKNSGYGIGHNSPKFIPGHRIDL